MYNELINTVCFLLGAETSFLMEVNANFCNSLGKIKPKPFPHGYSEDAKFLLSNSDCQESDSFALLANRIWCSH